jgi:hypothetical protein
MVGAPRFEFGTPSPPDCWSAGCITKQINRLDRTITAAPGLSPGLCVAILHPVHCIQELIIEHVGVRRGGADPRVIEQLLHHFEVPGVPEQSCAGRMAIVVETECQDRR